jgi:hypothetical protein
MEIYKHEPKCPMFSSVKLHTQDKPIRPIVTWKTCPAYKVAKYLNKILPDTLQLPYTFNIKN